MNVSGYAKYRQPRMGRNRPEFGEGVRSFIVESYVIIVDTMKVS
jgi:hypothetical protein